MPATPPQDNSTAASEPDKKVEEIQLPGIAGAGVSFLVLPFFALWRKDASKRARTQCRIVADRGDVRIEIVWAVISNPEFGYPGPFDRAVHKAIEQIVSELPLPVQNPISIGTLHDLHKKIGFKESGQAQYEKTKEAFERIAATTIRLAEACLSEEKQEWVEDTFHLYDRVILKGEKLRNGETADSNYLYLSSWYLDNINSRYVKPVDWNYYSSLKTPIAQRLYELLRVKLYGMMMRKDGYLHYKYSTLCHLMPATPQKHLSAAKRIFDPAHERLKTTGFLLDWSWEELTQTDSEKDWLIRYYLGERAKKESEWLGIGEQLEFELPQTKGNEEESPVSKSDAAQKQKEIMDQKAKDRKERWLRHREKLIEQDMSNWDKTPPADRVKGMLGFWIVGQKLNGPPPTSYQIEIRKQELIDNLPGTDEGKREYIARNHPEEPPDDFQ